MAINCLIKARFRLFNIMQTFRSKQLEYMLMICKTEWDLVDQTNLTEVTDGNDITDFFIKVSII